MRHCDIVGQISDSPSQAETRKLQLSSSHRLARTALAAKFELLADRDGYFALAEGAIGTGAAEIFDLNTYFGIRSQPRLQRSRFRSSEFGLGASNARRDFAPSGERVVKGNRLSQRRAGL
nr:hypothetical protein [Novosphingobium sp. UBA6272]